MAEYLSLILLIVVSYSLVRAKERYFSGRLESYNKLMVGVFCWLSMLLFRNLAVSNLLGSSPVFARLEYQYFAEALLLVAGGVFLVLGATEWITKISNSEQREDKLHRHLDLLNAIDTKLAHGDLRESTLGEIRVLIKHFLGATAVNFYQNNHFSGSFEPAEINSLALPISKDRDADYSSVVANSTLSVIPAEVSRDGMPTAIMSCPTLSNQRGVMVITLPRERTFSADLIRTLNLVMRLMQTKQVGLVNNTEQLKIAELFGNLRHRIAGSERLQDNMQDIFDTLQQMIPCDILRIAIYDSRGYNVTQYCLGKGKNLLSERNKSISTQKTHLGHLFLNPKVEINDELETSEFADDRWLSSCGAKSTITFPIISGGVVLAAVTVASEEEKFTLEFEDTVRNELHTTLLPLVRTDIMSHQLVSYNRQFLELTGALKRMVSSGDVDSFLQDLADSVVKKLPVTYCRFWKYDHEKETLDFMVDAQSRDIHNQVTALSSIPLSRAKWHKLALETGRTVLVNQREERMQMGDQEVLQTLLTGLQSALIIPMTAGSELIGVMTLAELRSWERQNFSLSDSLFARGIANIAAQSIANSESQDKLTNMGKRLTQLEETKMVNEVFTSLPSRWATPLTSILARTDRLLSSTGQYDPEARLELQVIKAQSEKLVNEVRRIQDARHVQMVQ